MTDIELAERFLAAHEGTFHWYQQGRASEWQVHFKGPITKVTRSYTDHEVQARIMTWYRESFPRVPVDLRLIKRINQALKVVTAVAQ